jgi:membrane protein YqaA with SNARE-associated domain
VPAWLLSFFFSTLGVCILGALDSSLIFFLPLAVDAGVVYLASRNPHLFWLYPLLVSASSMIGVAVTYYIGERLGEAELQHFVSKRKLQMVTQRTRIKGAAIAVLDFIPPPFPFTAFILAAGALKISRHRFFVALYFVRLIRFGVEATLALLLGARVIAIIQSPIARHVAEFFTAMIIVGSLITAYQAIRKNARRRTKDRGSRAA